MTKIKPKEGDVVAIPLLGHGYVAAVVANYPGRGNILVLRVFGPRKPTPEAAARVVPDSPKGALMTAVTATQPIAEGKWQIVARVPGFTRGEWAQTEFLRDEPFRRGTLLVTYAENNPNKVLFERTATAEEAQSLPRADLFGSEILASHIDELLIDREREDPATWGPARR
jgi:hypothetical protein